MAEQRSAPHQKMDPVFLDLVVFNNNLPYNVYSLVVLNKWICIDYS